MSDTEEYLQPGFDPATLTVPRLRSILVTYNVHYASNSKKSDLVDLFNTNIAPQASKILARRARAKRSSMGIVDAGEPAQSYGTASGFDDLAPPSTKPRRSTSRQPREPVMQSAEVDAEVDEDAGRRTRRASPRKRQTRSTSYQPQPLPAQPPASDTDTGPDVEAARKRPVSSRRIRAQTPKVKLEPPEEEDTGLLPSRAPTASPSRSAHPRASSRQHRQEASTDEETTFTDDNPFQSGSSPLAAASNAADVRRRRTVAAEPASAIKKRPSAVAAPSPDPFYSRRLTTDIVLPPSASSSFTLVNPTTPAPETDEEDEEEDEEEVEASVLEPGEEFTPEAQLELAQEEEAARQRNAAGRRAGKKNKAPATRRRGICSVLATPLLVLLLTLLGAYGAWYRQEKIAVGYCGLGRLAVPLLAQQMESLEGFVGDLVARLPEPARDVVQSLDLHTPASLQVLIEPQCEPCPLHAFCYADLTARCESGYLLQPNPWSLGGLVPLAPTCEPDGERARRVKAVADKAIEELRDRRARWECGDLVDDDGTPATGPAMDVPQLKEIIGDKRSKKMSKDEFDDLWTVALGEIESREEVEVEPVYETSDSGTVSNARLSSTSLARLPFTCALRRSIRLSVARYRFALSVLVLSFLAALYVRASFRARRAMRARVPALVDVALERLIAQKVLFLEDDEEYGEEEGGNGGSRNAGAVEEDDEDLLRPDPFLFLPQLRDDVLRSTHSLAARERIWKHVRAVVEQNSNVRAGQRQGRNGEVGRAWEWVGPVGMARAAAGDDGSSGRPSLFLDRSARRRRSGRPSMGGPAGTAGLATPVPTAREPGNNRAAAGEARQAGPAGPEPGRENQSALHRRWQESRPVF